MKNILSVLLLSCGLVTLPVAHAADEAAGGQKGEQKAAGEAKDKKAGEDGKKSGEKKGDGGAEPECN